jgi:hypothetical protein
MALIRKNWQKFASNNAVNAVMRVVGAGASAFVLKKLTEDESTNLKKTIKNLSAPALTIVGVLGDLMFDDEKLKSVCQGVYTFSALKAAAVVAPSIGSYMGLQGVDGEQIIMNGAEAPIIMNGAETTEETTSAEVEEIQEIQNPNPDGETFKQVAEYIEQGADDAVKIGAITF